MTDQLDDVCRKMLDNADLFLDLSAYPNINMRFVVFGMVRNKFWEVRFECARAIYLDIANDGDVDPNEQHMVLDVSVESMPVKNCNPQFLWRFSAPSPDTPVWTIKVYGDVVINLVCCDFKWSLIEMTSEAYYAQCS